MREILFRGKRVDNQEWIYGDLRHWRSGNVGIHSEELHSTLYVDPDTVGEYTGIDDKNGKKIFEGDILYKPSWWWGPRFVYLTQGQCGPCHGENVMQYILAKNVDNPERHATWNLWDGCEVEIIGNVYDNVELLKEGK